MAENTATYQQQNKNNRLTITSLFFGIAILVMGCTGNVFAADSYLQELEAEATDTARTIGKELTPEEEAALALRDELERELKSKRTASHRFFIKLSNENKLEVLKVYKDSGKDLSKAANKVMDLYFE